MRFNGLLFAVLFAVGCGTGMHDPKTNFGSAFFPPSLMALAPNTSPVNAVPFTMRVNGTNFGTDAVVFWNNVPQRTRFISSTELLVSVTDIDLMQFGRAQVFVRTAGLNSNTVDFNVTAQ